MRALIALTVFGGGVAQATVAPALRIGDIAPDLPLIVVVLLALRRGPEFGCLAGFAAGLLPEPAGGGRVRHPAPPQGLGCFPNGALGGGPRGPPPHPHVPPLARRATVERPLTLR